MEPPASVTDSEAAIAALPQAGVALMRAVTAHDHEGIVTAVSTWRRLMVAVPETSGAWPAAMVMWSLALQASFECTGDIKELEEAVEAGRRGLETVQADYPDLAILLSNVAGVMRMRADNSGGAGGWYLDEAIRLYRQSVAAVPRRRRQRSGVLSSLAATLRARFEASGHEADLAESISFARQALGNARLLDWERHRYQTNLAVSLRVRHAVTGAPEDLSEATQLLVRALEWTPARHPEHASNCVNLAATLWTRYEESEAEQLLERIIGLLRRAAATVRDGDPTRALLLSNLSVAVIARFKRTGATADLDAAVDIARQAVSAAPRGNVNLARYQANLCGLLRMRGDAAAAVEAGQSAVASSVPGDPELPRRLANLAMAQHDAGDADGAIETLRQADSEGTADGLWAPQIRSDLGFALAAVQRNDEAMQVLGSALLAAPKGHLGRPTVLANLASVLRRSGNERDRAEALDLFAEAADTEYATPSLRVRAAWAAWANTDLSSVTETSRAAGLLELAVGLLPSIVPRGLYRGDQQRYLAQFFGLASGAAAAALAAGGPGSAERALRLLEAGRGVLLSQILDNRTDLTLLRRRHPWLAATYVRLRDQLDSDPGGGPAALSQGGSSDGFGAMALSMEQQAGERQRIAAKFAQTTAKIRALDGFSSFMLPPALDDLMAQAGHGPVAVLNLSVHRSDALLLTPGKIQTVSLPGLTPDAVLARLPLLQPSSVSTELPAVLDWLWDTITGPVLDALDIGQPGADGPLPRIWWIPVGLLSLLPIHAAGQAMDRVISSYAPTVRALAHARASGPSTTAARSLIVAMPSSPEPYHDLPGTSLEAESLERVLPQPTVLTGPTAAQVLAGLDAYTIAHFACHGITEPRDPSNSGLILADQPLTVTALNSVTLPVGRLAYLSACGTAASEAEGLADEAIHITSAFLLAGFPHVIGTLWPIDDYAAYPLAARFHATLISDGSFFDPAHAAEVLHDISQQARADNPDEPHLWAAHIHVGA